MRLQGNRRLILSSGKTTLFFVLAVVSLLCCNVAYSQDADEMYKAREMAKPWLMRNIEFGDTKLPISPASLITFLIVVLNLGIRLCGGPSRWAEANHILIKEANDKTKKALEGMKKDVGGNLKKFEEYAVKYSQCPSRNQNGDLGRFKPGAMTPPFDAAVFDSKNKTKTCIGPIQTQFGYHLIYIRDRNM